MYCTFLRVSRHLYAQYFTDRAAQLFLLALVAAQLFLLALVAAHLFLLPLVASNRNGRP